MAMKKSKINNILSFFYERTGELGVYCHYIYTVKIKHVPYFGLRYAASQLNGIRGYAMRRLIAKELKGKKSFNVLEIGSWAGESAILWASQMRKLGVEGKVTCIDPWILYEEIGGKKYPAGSQQRRMTKAFKVDRIFKLFLHNITSSGYSDIITYHREASGKYLPTLPADSFDIVYIDGDHLYRGVKSDIENSMKIVKTGGVICGDDLELQVPDLDENIDLESVRKGTGDEYPEIPTHMGVAVAVWDTFKSKVFTMNGFWAMRKVTGGFQEVDLRARI